MKGEINTDLGKATSISIISPKVDNFLPTGI